MGDFMQIIGVTALVCVLTFAVGAGALKVLHARSLLISIVVAALVPLAAVSVAVLVNVRLMFLSTHDSRAVLVALGCAVLIAVALAVVLGRGVARSSRDLTTALRDLGGPVGGPDGGDPDRIDQDGSNRGGSDRPWSDHRGSDGRGSDLPGHSTPRPGHPALTTAPAELSALARELSATRDRLADAQRRARGLEDSRRELVAFMSHDLRTPLAGLRALAEGLEDGVIDDQPAALRQVRLTVERMNGLVTDLFEVSRLRAGPAPETATRTMVSLVELSHDVVGELSAHAAGRGVTLRLHAPEDDRLAVLGNADELARALTNLVANAVRHTVAGSEVVLDAVRRPDGRIALGVTDGCGGIAEADLHRVFDLGWRADPGRTTTDAGAGLGLAIAKGVAEAHHGTIGVANVPGGCRFALVLPSE